MATYAQLSDVESAIGKPIPVEVAHSVSELLDEAEIRLAAVVGYLPDRVTSELTTADRLKTAVVGMVVEVLKGEMWPELAGSCLLGDLNEVFYRLDVGRREKYLSGVSAAGASLSLGEADSTLPWVLRRPRRRHYDEWSGEWSWR